MFFIAVGMALDPRQVLAQWPEVLAFAALALLGKTIAVSLGAFLLGHGVQTSIAGLGAATALQWPVENGDLDDVTGDELVDNFYASP